MFVHFFNPITSTITCYLIFELSTHHMLFSWDLMNEIRREWNKGTPLEASFQLLHRGLSMKLWDQPSKEIIAHPKNPWPSWKRCQRRSCLFRIPTACHENGTGKAGGQTYQKEKKGAPILTVEANKPIWPCWLLLPQLPSPSIAKMLGWRFFLSICSINSLIGEAISDGSWSF